MRKATFERCAGAMLAEVSEIFTQRGQEYSDTWATKNQVSTFTRQTLRDVFGIDVKAIDATQIRLLLAAALVDVKDSRMLGPHKRDTHIDGVAYRALYAQLREEWEQARKVKPRRSR
jgi:hypothetical protein